MLEADSCDKVNDAKLAEIGVHQSGDDTWIVMASRTEIPFAALQDPAAVAGRVLELVNAARAQARQCGRDAIRARSAADDGDGVDGGGAVHSLDMAERGSPGHDGSDGSSSGERITRTGYVWQISGENVAAGQRDAERVVAAWLDSPGHCATLMDARFTETRRRVCAGAGQEPGRLLDAGIRGAALTRRAANARAPGGAA